MRWFHHFRRAFYSLRHRYALDELNTLIHKCYREGEAKTLGRPLYANRKEDRRAFERYFSDYHFEKNFYTNYHALRKLFCSAKNVEIPKRLNIYDIACGPCTASVSLLNFLGRNGGWRRKRISFSFCDKGDLFFEKLRKESEGGPRLSFPISCFSEIDTTFRLKEWNVRMSRCSHEQAEVCIPYKEMNHVPLKRGRGGIFPQTDAISLIFLSYPGIRYEIKFIRCVEKIISGFPPEQRRLPTYIIHSHYAGKDEVEKDMRKAEAFRVKSVISNEDEPVPFSSYHYHIFEAEVADESLPV